MLMSTLNCFAKKKESTIPLADCCSPPDVDVIKFNVDGAYVEGQRKGGWGVVARTEKGQVVAAKAGCTDTIYDAFTAELRAMEEAVNLAADLGVIRAVFLD